MKMKTKYFALIFLVSLLFVFAANGYAGEVRIVQGSIENIRAIQLKCMENIMIFPGLRF